MSNLKLPDVSTFADAERVADNAPASGSIAYETRAVKFSRDEVAFIHHTTAIVTYHRDGRIVLDNGGWASPTTADRMRKLTPANVDVRIRDFAMYLSVNGGVMVDLTGKMTVHPDGVIESDYHGHPIYRAADSDASPVEWSRDRRGVIA